jgi:hypothetical protein
MPIFRMYVVVPILISLSLVSSGCDDSDSKVALSNGVGPSPVASPLFVSRGAMVRPSSIEAQRVFDAACPAQPPFLAPFNVVFEGDGRSGVFLSDVQMQFVDSAGTRAGSMTLGPSALAARFGSTRVPASGTRTFPFAFPFGCVGLPTGTLTVVVVAGDGNGRENRTAARLPVRRTAGGR